MFIYFILRRALERMEVDDPDADEPMEVDDYLGEAMDIDYPNEKEMEYFKMDWMSSEEEPMDTSDTELICCPSRNIFDHWLYKIF